MIRLKELNKASGHHAENLLEIVTKAKSNAVAYTKPQKACSRGRGRPRLKGEAVHLKDLWNDKGCFGRAAVHIYGREETVRYRCANLLWGRGIYQELRFVLTVLENGEKSILVSTDFFRKQLFVFLLKHPDSPITRFIRERQMRDYAELEYA